MSSPALWIYLLFVVSWFTHVTSRLPVLGVLRLDLLLVVCLALPAFAAIARDRNALTWIDKFLWILIAYVLLTVPLVEWPGSVMQRGLPDFVKAVIFYFFTIAFVRTPSDLKKLIVVFVACQLFRVLEPLYLNFTQGYWGSVAYMEGGEEFFDRLAGAPHDVINPNGLAFVICTALPFLWVLGRDSPKSWLPVAALVGACLYALALTGSRTGMLALAIVYAGVLLKSRRKLLVVLAGVAVIAYAAPRLDADLQDRYLSIVGLGSKNLGTAAGRIDAISENFAVALQRPLFGHGVGTSAEANYHFSGYGQISHNLYTEVAQELGFIGLAIFAGLLAAISRSLFAFRKAMMRDARTAPFLASLTDAVQVWFAVVLLFSLASYGLSSYEWYLLAALPVVIRRLAADEPAAVAAPVGTDAEARVTVYVDFEQGLQGSPPIARAMLPGAGDVPTPGAIEFLREAAGRFTVVVCSPHCATTQGKRALSEWLNSHGAPVSRLRFSAERPVADVGRGSTIGFTGRWPTVDELNALFDGHGYAH